MHTRKCYHQVVLAATARPMRLQEKFCVGYNVCFFIRFTNGLKSFAGFFFFNVLKRVAKTSQGSDVVLFHYTPGRWLCRPFLVFHHTHHKVRGSCQSHQVPRTVCHRFPHTQTHPHNSFATPGMFPILRKTDPTSKH